MKAHFSDRRADGLRVWLQTTGSVVAVLVLVQFLTGVLLAFYYVPSVDHAHTTVSYIEKVVSSGSWLRSLHHYGSQWLAFFVFFHVVRLFLTEAYVERRIQWVTAVLLLALVVAAAGTGYSLPWDARAFFSTRVAEGLMSGLPFAGPNARYWLLGGNEISTITLSRFFALHVLVVPFAIIAVIAGAIAWRCYHRCWPDLTRNAIAAGAVFLALAIWCVKYPAPLGPRVDAMTADYLPRPGAQFLWLFQLLKYVPGGLGSIAGVILPAIGLVILLLLPRLKPQRIVGSAILITLTVIIATMTITARLSDRRDPHTREQLARQATAEQKWRREPFNPRLLQSSLRETPGAEAGGPPVMYLKFCVNCHGPHGEGAQQGTLRFPSLLDVASKPRRTTEDIVNLLKDPAAYGLQPPMRSFNDKLSEEQMREIAAWVVQLKR